MLREGLLFGPFVQALPNAGLIDTVGRVVARVFAIGIGLKELRENDLWRISATRGKSIPHHGPLRLTPKAENLAQVVNEAREDHPARLPIAAQVLSRLKQVLQLRHVGVRIRIVDELVEVLGRLPDAHGHPVQTQVLLPFTLPKLVGLVGVVQPVELPHCRPGVGFVVAELGLLLFGRVSHGRLAELRSRCGTIGLWIMLNDELFPFPNVLEWLLKGFGLDRIHR